jgi:hypothetical protein
MSASKPTTKPRTRNKRSEAPPEAPPAISPQEYAQFIGQIELSTIWLHDVRVANYHGPQTPDQATFHFASEARWELRPTGFRVFHQYKVLVEATEDQLAEMDVTFGLDFTSQEPMTDQIFAIFEDVNLPVNTWPFLREFVSTTLGRMGWVSFTLPTFKRGVSGAGRPTKATRTRAAQGHQRKRVADQV